MSTDELKTPQQASEFTKIKQKTLDNWRSQGRGPAFVKLGSRIFYKAKDLEAYVEQNRHEPLAS